MARRRDTTAGMDPFHDLAKKAEILEQELAVQRAAIDKLKELGKKVRPEPTVIPMPIRRTA
jgi:hypothetical protein